VLGVGVGNFPVVLSQKIIASKAGSSAHNLYLHIAAEMGLLALAVTLYVIFLFFETAHDVFFSATEAFPRLLAGGILLSFLWVFLYVMTDPIIFDERVFLLLGTLVALMWAIRYPTRLPASS
jgi:hypothetical protein